MSRILIVDDEASVRLLYRHELGCEGYEVVDTGSEIEALKILGREKIDAVVLDLCLRETEGAALLDKILSRQRHVPIIINTAYDQFRDDFHLWGADAFVLKSADLSELKSALARVMLPMSETPKKNGVRAKTKH
jgi:DNA-binding NtrC family response regulator